MKKNIITILKFLVFLALGIGLLWLVSRGLDFNKIFNEFLNANYYWILLSFVFATISHILRSLRWNMLINTLGYKTKLSSTFYSVMIGYLANLAIPRLGEITRCGVLSKTNKIPVDTLVGTVIVERTFDMICLLFIILLTVIFQFDFLSAFLHKYLITPLAEKLTGQANLLIIGAIGFVLLLIILYFLIKKYQSVLKKMKLYIKIISLILGIFNGLKSIKEVKRKPLFLLYTLLMWIMYTYMLYVCFFALPATSGLSITDGISAMAISSLGIVAPTPGGIGAYHAIVITMLTEIYQISREHATSFAYIVHAAQTFIIIILGVFSYLMIIIYHKKNKNKDAKA